ncbi:MAG: MauE/DoxX family redox-associated membrane protein [Butyricimonas faecihominis]
MRNVIVKMWLGIVLGVLFVVSGFVKAVDPMGLSYKMEEYLGLLGFSSWSTWVMFFSVLLCAAEIILGLLLLLHLWPRMTAVAVILFLSGFTVLTYLIYTDPYGGINECGCFGEALHLSNEATFAKNILFLIVAGVHLWFVFKQERNGFDYRQIVLAIGVFVVSFFIPLYSYFYLPPFDFLPYNVGTKIEAKNVIRLYDSGFNDVSETVFVGGKPTYMIGLKEKITPEKSGKLAALHEAYEKGKINLFIATSQDGIAIPGYCDVPVYFMDNVELKSILRTAAGVVAFADDRIVGKWNLLYTPYRFDGEYGNELIWEQIKRGAFFGVLLVMVVSLFCGRKKRKA